MGTIDFALGRDTIAMQLYLLALVLPLVAAGFDAQQMQQQQQQQQWQGMTNSADYEAYLKWCQENKMRMQEQERQQQLLVQFKAMEAKEREENMMAQWKGWEQRMKMSSNFEHLGYEIMEMKMKYYYMVTFEFLKFCKCQDKTSQIQAFFSHEGMSSNKADYEEFDLADLGITEAQSTDPNAVARALVNLSAQDQIKAYLYGLATDMCKGAQAYFDQVELWEKQYNFLEKLA